MEQHPIPQQISSYEFRLVGSMTLKQFFKLAGGLLIALVFYSTKIIFFLKWPLVIGSAGLGIALAFIPINERPLEIWITSFFKSIFQPTIFLWKKQPAIIFDVLEASGKKVAEEKPEETEKITPLQKPKVEEFLKTLPLKKEGGAPFLTKTEDIKPKNQPERETTTQTLYQNFARSEEIAIPKISTLKPTAEAEFGEIPMPETPTAPNIIAGMVTDSEGKIIEGAIIEIQDTNGNPFRALRTNNLGQFKTAAPLSNGTYVILTEKEGYQFDILKLTLKGEIVMPIKIKAKPPITANA